MKIDKEKVKERLAGVPESRRSHIYDASIVLEFLVTTFMPTKFFLPEGFSPTPGIQLGEKSMRKVSEGKALSIGDLYEMYMLFREEKDYTAKIESKYIFGIIIRNLRYYKNGWEFVVYRVGVAQIWHVGPLVMRKDVPAEVRGKYAARLENKTVEGNTVEADPVSEPEEEIEGATGAPISDENFVGPTPAGPDDIIEGSTGGSGLLGEVKEGQLGHRPDVDRFVEATGSRFTEAEITQYEHEQLSAREEY